MAPYKATEVAEVPQRVAPVLEGEILGEEGGTGENSEWLEGAVPVGQRRVGDRAEGCPTP